MAWKPGESGNPQGRPKRGHSIVASLSAKLSKRVDTGAVNPATGRAVRATRAEIIAENLIEIASQREDKAPAVAAFKEIADRVEGKVPLPVKQQVTGQLALPIITHQMDLGFDDAKAEK